MENLVSIRQALEHAGDYDGWFYLPPRPWGLDTKGVFVVSDKDAEPGSTAHIPDFVKAQGWKESLDTEGIEDVVENAGYQLANPTVDDLFKAFVFYLDNDAFIEF